MSTPEQEHLRLATHCSRMSDGELEKLAAFGFELSEAARQALEAEIAHRGINLAIAPPHPESTSTN